jgi:hypothetical protein
MEHPFESDVPFIRTGVRKSRILARHAGNRSYRCLKMADLTYTVNNDRARRIAAGPVDSTT